MPKSSSTLAEKILGKGMVLAPELSHITRKTTSQEITWAYQDYAEKFVETQKRIDKLPLCSGQCFKFKGPSLRKCGIGKERLEGARTELLLNDDAEYELELQYCFSGGPDRWAQVWRCLLIGDGIPQDTKVVLKLYQSSYFPQADDGNFWPGNEEFGKCIEPPQNFARREACAYRRLAEQQGLKVPYCYGFHKFFLPCHEEVEGVILEALDGISCMDYLKEHANYWPIAHSQFNLVRPIWLDVFETHSLFYQKYRVLHRDLGMTNFLLLTDFENPCENPSLVYFDFGHSRTPETIPPTKSLRNFDQVPMQPLYDDFGRTIIDSNLECEMREFLKEQARENKQARKRKAGKVENKASDQSDFCPTIKKTRL